MPSEAKHKPGGGLTHPIVLLRLAQLHLDGSNPRFGKAVGNLSDETAILDYIVNTFGVEDVLSSIAVNGYFQSEPLLGFKKSKSDDVTIVEGNRRLVACLIIAGDLRAKNQKRRQEQYRALHEQHGSKRIDPAPVMVFEGKIDLEDLLPYLGVRHIAGSRQWDSYAKAAWVARMVEKNEIDLADIIQMIGDENNTAQRILEGYYFVNQLIETAHFAPEESRRKGLGSNADYPFSWIYTALGYAPVRRFLGLPDRKDSEPKKNPLKKERLADGALLVNLMFGNKGRSPAIDDSRKLMVLAWAIEDPVQRRMLASGKTVDEIAERMKPVRNQLSEGLAEVHEKLSRILQLLGEGSVDADDAEDVLKVSKKVRSLGIQVYRHLEDLSGGGEVEE